MIIGYERMLVVGKVIPMVSSCSSSWGGVTLQDPRVLNLKMGKPKKITAMETMGTLLGLLECRAIGSLASCFASC